MHRGVGYHADDTHFYLSNNKATFCGRYVLLLQKTSEKPTERRINLDDFHYLASGL